MLKPGQIKKRRETMQERARLREEAEANEIVSRLKHGGPKYMILPDKPFSAEYWITWPPKNEKQTLSKEEEDCPGCRRDNASITGAS